MPPETAIAERCLRKSRRVDGETRKVGFMTVSLRAILSLDANSLQLHPGQLSAVYDPQARRCVLFLSLQILEIATYIIDPFAIGLGVSVRQEMRVPVVRVLNPSRVPDRAPMLLGSTRDFHNEGEHSVSIRAVQAIESFDRVQVSQFVPVDRDIVPAARLGDAVDGKADGLIHRNEKIQQNKRNNHSINKWRRQNREDSGMQDVSRQRSFQAAMFLLDFLGEPDLALAQLIKFRLDFLFQFFDYGELKYRIVFP